MFSGIFVYTIVWMVSCMIVHHHYNRQRMLNEGTDEWDRSIRNNVKMPVFTALVVSGLFTLFNVYATTQSVIIGGDRQNYILNFNGYRQTPSIGLGFVIDFVHLIGGDIYTLFYVTTFICVFITLMAYRLSKKADPHAFYLLCITQYFLATLTALKQCYASAFAVLFFVLLLEYHSRKSRLAAILCIVLACLFHPSGYILIPLYIIGVVKKTGRNIAIYLLALIIIGVFFERFMLGAAILLKPMAPSLTTKLLEYFGESTDMVQNGISISFLKGIPYYFIALVGLARRKYFRDEIDNYDSYLVIVVTGAFIYLISIYSTWLGRFIYFFSFVTFVFYSQLLKTMTMKARMTYGMLVQGSLVLVTYRFLYLVYKLYGGF